MKKLLSIALCAAAASAFADPTEVELGEVGVTAINSVLSNTIVAVSYDDLAGGSGMIVSNFVKTTNLTAGDQLAIFNNGTGTEEIYDTWVLRKNGSNVLYWEKNTKTYMVRADGQLEEGSGVSASSITNAVGTGIWLIRQKPTDGNTAVPFYIYGKPSTAMTIKTKPNVWNLVGNPTQGDVPITKEITSGVQDDDQILVPAKNGLVTYLYREGKGWRAAADASGKWGAAPTVVAGTGFWIMTKSEVTITWSTAQ